MRALACAAAYCCQNGERPGVLVCQPYRRPRLRGACASSSANPPDIPPLQQGLARLVLQQSLPGAHHLIILRYHRTLPPHNR